MGRTFLLTSVLDSDERKEPQNRIGKTASASVAIHATHADCGMRRNREIRGERATSMSSLESDLRGIKTLARSERMQIAEILRRTDDMLRLNEHTMSSLKSIVVDLRTDVLDRATVASHSLARTTNLVSIDE